MSESGLGLPVVSSSAFDLQDRKKVQDLLSLFRVKWPLVAAQLELLVTSTVGRLSTSLCLGSVECALVAEELDRVAAFLSAVILQATKKSKDCGNCSECKNCRNPARFSG